jgi:hypothetical protein
MSYLGAMIKGQWIGLSRLEIRLSLLPKLKGRIFINQGVGQKTIQLQASSQRNKKRRTYNKTLREDVMYVIVSIGVD